MNTNLSVLKTYMPKMHQN